MPVAAHGWSTPLMGLTEAIAGCETPFTEVISPPKSNRDPSGAIAVSVTRPTVFAVNAVETLPLVVFKPRCVGAPCS